MRVVIRSDFKVYITRMQIDSELAIAGLDVEKISDRRLLNRDGFNKQVTSCIAHIVLDVSLQRQHNLLFSHIFVNQDRI